MLYIGTFLSKKLFVILIYIDGKWRESTCGRPLGMRFDSNGNLIVANCYFGIFRVDVDTGWVWDSIPTLSDSD